MGARRDRAMAYSGQLPARQRALAGSGAALAALLVGAALVSSLDIAVIRKAGEAISAIALPAPQPPPTPATPAPAQSDAASGKASAANRFAKAAAVAAPKPLVVPPAPPPVAAAPTPGSGNDSSAGATPTPGAGSGAMPSRWHHHRAVAGMNCASPAAPTWLTASGFQALSWCTCAAKAATGASRPHWPCASRSSVSL